MIVRSVFSKRTGRYLSPVGSRIYTRRIKKRDENGDFILVDVESVDLQDQINSFRDSCLIENIVKRYVNGDATALNASPGVFMDTLGMPNDIFQAHEYLAKARDLYFNMPHELRGEFDTFDSFVSSMGSKEGIDAFYKRVYDLKVKKASEQKAQNEKKGGENDASK